MKKNIIVISTKKSDTENEIYEILAGPDSHLPQKALCIFFHSCQEFDDFIRSQHKDYEFVLLIHIGKLYGVPTHTRILEELQSKPYYTSLKYEFISRGGETDLNGKLVRHTPKLGTKDYDITGLPVNKITDLLSEHLSGTGPSAQPVDFAVLTALYRDEMEAFKEALSHAIVPGERNLLSGSFKHKQLDDDYTGKLILTWQDEMGMVDAAAFTAKIITQHSPKFMILAGVCGGLSEEVKLYDVIIPKNIFDYISGKLVKGEFLPQPLQAPLNTELIQYIESESKMIKQNMLKIAPRILQPILEDGFKIHFKDYACGPWVIKTEGTLKTLSQTISNKIVGLEMESLGVIRAANIFAKYRNNGLVVKSVMDFTDENKTDGFKGQIKTTAAEISYICVRAMMPVLLKFVDSRV
jgi:nucleoside phosphorylase